MYTTAFHSWLLPLFFIVHAYVQYAGMVTPGAALQTGALLLGATALVFGLVRLALRHTQKAFVMTTLLMLAYLFYGNTKDTLAGVLPLLSRYIVLLPLLLAMLIAAVLWIRRHDTARLNFYLNIVLGAWVLLDAGQLAWLKIADAGSRQSLFAQQAPLPDPGQPGTAGKPDIYYLLFDSYPNCEVIRRHQPSPAFSLDTFLEARHFYVVPHSISNYNNTAFSMNATLNMQYLQKLDDSSKKSGGAYTLSPVDYSKALLDINRAPLFPFLAKRGYALYNLSIFRLNNQEPVYREGFLTVSPKEILLYNTLWSCVSRDIGWHFVYFVGRFRDRDKQYDADFRREKEVNGYKRAYNQQILDSVARIPAAATDGRPRFVYAHLYLPHYPYFYTAEGRPLDDTAVFHHGFLWDIPKFIGYVNYTNQKIKAVTDSLLKATGGKAVIIIQSDHGYPGFEPGGFPDFFKNLSALYFPDGQYGALHDSLSNVNTFRIVINKYFQEHLPLLPDSSIRLRH